MSSDHCNIDPNDPNLPPIEPPPVPEIPPAEPPPEQPEIITQSYGLDPCFQFRISRGDRERQQSTIKRPLDNYDRVRYESYYASSDYIAQTTTLNSKLLPLVKYNRSWTIKEGGNTAVNTHRSAIYDNALTLIDFNNRTYWIRPDEEEEYPALWSRGLTSATCVVPPSIPDDAIPPSPPEEAVPKQTLEFYVPETQAIGSLEPTVVIQITPNQPEIRATKVRLRMDVTVASVERKGPASRPTSLYVNLFGNERRRSFRDPNRGRERLLVSERFEILDFQFGERTLTAEAIVTPDFLTLEDTHLFGQLAADAHDVGVHFEISKADLSIEECQDDMDRCFNTSEPVIVPTRIELVSEALCDEFTLNEGEKHYRNCHPSTDAIELLYAPDYAIPRRTTLTVIKSSECSFQLGSIEVRVDNEEWHPWRFDLDERMVLRRRDRRPVEKVEIRDAERFPLRSAIYPEGCTIGVALVEDNVPDVNSRREAQDLVDGVRNRWLEAQSARDGWQAIAGLSSALELLEFLSNYWFNELQLSTQEFRVLAADVAEAYALLYGLALSGDLSLIDVEINDEFLHSLLDLQIYIEASISTPVPATGQSYGEALGAGDLQLLEQIRNIIIEYHKRNIAAEYQAWEQIVQQLRSQLDAVLVLVSDWLDD